MLNSFHKGEVRPGQVRGGGGRRKGKGGRRRLGGGVRMEMREKMERGRHILGIRRNSRRLSNRDRQTDRHRSRAKG